MLTNRPDGDAFESLSAVIPGGSGITLVGGSYNPATGTLAFDGQRDEGRTTRHCSPRSATTTPRTRPTRSTGSSRSPSTTATPTRPPGPPWSRSSRSTSPPEVDLDTGTAGNDSSASFTEDCPAVTVAPNATVTDTDDTDMEAATVVLTTRPDGNAVESLTRRPSPVAAASPSSARCYDQATGTLTFTGTSSKANYATLLGSIQYDNSSDTPTTTRPHGDVQGQRRARRLGAPHRDGLGGRGQRRPDGRPGQHPRRHRLDRDLHRGRRRRVAGLRTPRSPTSTTPTWRRRRSR